MKKQIFIAIVMVLPFLFSLQSCTKDDGNTSVAELGTATITGRVTGYMDLLAGEKTPIEGIKVIAKIDLIDLVTSGSVPDTNAARVYEGVTNADGYFTIKLEAGNKPLNVTVDFPNTLNLEQKQENGKKEIAEYNVNNAVRNIVLYKGQTKTENAVYNFKREFNSESVKIKGNIRYFYEPCPHSTTPTDERYLRVPDNTILIFRWKSDESTVIDREMEVKVKDGKYEFTTQTTEASKTFEIKGRKFFEEIKDDDGAGDCKRFSDHGYTSTLKTISVNKGELEVLDIDFK